MGAGHCCGKRVETAEVGEAAAEIDISKLSGVASKVKHLKEALVIIDDMDSPLDRVAAYQNLGKALMSPKRS